MLKNITSILRAKLVDWENSQTIGEVADWIVDPDHKKISALVIKSPGLFKKNFMVATIDIVEYGPGMVIVRNQNAVVPASEIAGLDKLLKSKQKIINSPVKTQSGKHLGQVEDLLFETTDSTIQKIYIRPRMIDLFKSADLIIGVDKIISITPQYIIVQDDAGDILPQRIVDTSSA